MATSTIPLLAGQPQFVTVPISGLDYRLGFAWIDAPQGGWVLSIERDADGAALLSGVPLITGADILAPHRHLGIGAEFYLTTTGDADAVATFDGLGVTSQVLVVTEDA